MRLNDLKSPLTTPPRFAIRGALAARNALRALLDAITPPQLKIIEHATALAQAQLIHVAARLGVADHLASGPRSAGELAVLCSAHEDSLARAMRALVSLGVFARDADGRFRNNRVSDALRRDAPMSIRAFAEYFAAPYHARAWAEFGHTIATGESAFEHEYKTTFWDYCKERPEAAACFADAMAEMTRLEAPAIAAGYPFQEIGRVCDIAGGSGTLIAEILAQHPRLRGILFDEAHILEGAAQVLSAKGVQARCETVAGSFFNEVPRGADAYVLKNILHDWDDARSKQILSVCRKAMNPGDKLLVVEFLIEDGSTDPIAAISDMQMMAVGSGGRQRSEADLRALFRATGFRLTRVVPLSALASVVEGAAE